MTKTQQKDYWTALNGVLEELDGPIRGDKTPQPYPHMDYWSRQRARVKFGLTAMMSTKEDRVEVKLWGPNDAKDFWDRLEGQKEAIKEKLGFDLQWPPPTRVEAKISTFLYNMGLKEDSGGPNEQHIRLAKRLNKMHEVLAPLVEIWHSRTESQTQDRAVIRHLRSLHSNADLKLKYGPGGEGTRHRNLKELISRNPDMLNLGSGDATVEHRFMTGDRVDVWIKLESGEHCVVEIELEGYQSTLTGAHQALKYRALLAAQLDTIRLPHAFLVAYSIPRSIKEFCERHGVVALEIPQD